MRRGQRCSARRQATAPVGESRVPKRLTGFVEPLNLSQYGRDIAQLRGVRIAKGREQRARNVPELDKLVSGRSAPASLLLDLAAHADDLFKLQFKAVPPEQAEGKDQEVRRSTGAIDAREEFARRVCITSGVRVESGLLQRPAYCRCVRGRPAVLKRRSRNVRPQVVVIAHHAIMHDAQPVANLTGPKLRANRRWCFLDRGNEHRHVGVATQNSDGHDPGRIPTKERLSRRPSL